MRSLRALGVIFLIAATLGLVGYLTYVTEPVQAPGWTTTPPGDHSLTEGDCDASYPGVCIPPYSVVGDLNCKEIAERRFEVKQPDPHFFDPDFDGVGCEVTN